jgi:hypothetical protein
LIHPVALSFSFIFIDVVSLEGGEVETSNWTSFKKREKEETRKRHEIERQKDRLTARQKERKRERQNDRKTE